MDSEPITHKSSMRICNHMNKDHQDAINSYARYYGKIENFKSAKMISLCQKSIELKVDDQISLKLGTNNNHKGFGNYLGFCGRSKGGCNRVNAGITNTKAESSLRYHSARVPRVRDRLASILRYANRSGITGQCWCNRNWPIFGIRIRFLQIQGRRAIHAKYPESFGNLLVRRSGIVRAHCRCPGTRPESQQSREIRGGRIWPSLLARQTARICTERFGVPHLCFGILQFSVHPHSADTRIRSS